MISEPSTVNSGLAAVGSGTGVREPLPAWAVALVEGLTAGTWKAVKAELLAGA